MVMVVMKMVESRQSLPSSTLLPTTPPPPDTRKSFRQKNHKNFPPAAGFSRFYFSFFFSSFSPPLHSDTPSHVSSATHTLPTVSSAAMLSVLIQCVCRGRGQGGVGWGGGGEGSHDCPLGGRGRGCSSPER